MVPIREAAMARGFKPVPLTLSDEEGVSLEGIVRRRREEQALAQRARIVLACAEVGAYASVCAFITRNAASREAEAKRALPGPLAPEQRG